MELPVNEVPSLISEVPFADPVCLDFGFVGLTVEKLHIETGEFAATEAYSDSFVLESEIDRRRGLVAVDQVLFCPCVHLYI